MYTRRLLIHSMANMRELGGYATIDGQATQYGRFIRSDVPSGLTDADIAYLVKYGVGAVIDLRSVQEVKHTPNPLAQVSGIAYHHISFSEQDLLINNLSFSPKDHYVPVMQGQNRLKEVLAVMAQAEGAALFHCTAGKDRTGITSAVLLLLAGVPTEDVLADYQVTFTYIKKNLIKYISGYAGTPEGDLSPADLEKLSPMLDICRSEAEWLEPFLALVDERGGIESFLAGLGVPETDLARLKHKLLAPKSN